MTALRQARPLLVMLAALHAFGSLACRSTAPESLVTPSASASAMAVAVEPPELHASDHLLGPGDVAPRFLGLAHTGAWVGQDNFPDRPTVLLLSSGAGEWTAILVALRDAWLPMNERIGGLLAISPLDGFASRDLAAEQRLPMLLVGDPDGKIRAAFGVQEGHGNVLVVIDSAGRIQRVTPNVVALGVVTELRAALGPLGG